MGRRYAKSPIIEVVCEFRVDPATPWDLTTPGFIYEKISETFPHRESRVMQEVEITQQHGEVRQEVRSQERALFLAEDRRRFVQVGRHMLAVNALAPYPTWEVFFPLVEQALDALAGTADIEGLQRIGLRYINHIDIPSPGVRVDEYLEFRPYLGERLPREVAEFLLTCILPFAGGRDLCRVQSARSMTGEEDRNATRFVLDLDYFLAKPAVRLGKALEWVRAAHERAVEAFEGCITDKARELFGEA